MRYFTLARYTDEGILDTSFGGGDGFVLTAFPSATAQKADSIVIDSDEKIVAGGAVAVSGGAGDRIALARYLSDGSLDEEFGEGDGLVTTDFNTWAHSSIAIDSEGSIIVAGSVEVDGQGQFALVRFLSDGSPDSSFGTDGKVILTEGFPSASGSAARSIAIDTKGRIVAAGDALVNGYRQFALARYTDKGILDEDYFGEGDGLVTTEFPTDFPSPGSGGGSTAWSIAIDTEGRIVAAGYAFTGGFSYFALARYTDEGILDEDYFGEGDGLVTTAFSSGSSIAYSITIDTEGRIVAAGWADVDDRAQFALARYLSDGSLDNSFGKDKNGRVLTDFPSASSSGANSIAIDSKGRIVAGGSADVDGRYQFALVRYLSDGTLDEEFGDDGKLLTKFAYKQDIASIAIDSEGNIVVGGWAESPSFTGFPSPQLIAAMLAALVAIGFLGFYLGWWGEGCPPYCLPIPDWFIHNR